VFKAQQPEVAKYIVLRWQGREQVTVFPFKAKHADVLAYIRGDSPDVQAVSAGFYLNEPDAFWSGGESDTLNLKSRPEDRQLLREFFESENRRQWDLNIVAQEAEASAALAGAN
jgi:hypothetical protein